MDGQQQPPPPPQQQRQPRGQRPCSRQLQASGLALALLLIIHLTSPNNAFTLQTLQSAPRSRSIRTVRAATATGGSESSSSTAAAAARAVRERLLEGERAGSLVVSTGRFPLIGMPAWSPPLHVGVLLSVEEKKGGGACECMASMLDPWGLWMRRGLLMGLVWTGMPASP